MRIYMFGSCLKAQALEETIYSNNCYYIVLDGNAILHTMPLQGE